MNIRKVPREVLKTEGFPNVNAWKIMFDPYIQTLEVSVLVIGDISCQPLGGFSGLLE